MKNCIDGQLESMGGGIGAGAIQMNNKAQSTPQTPYTSKKQNKLNRINLTLPQLLDL